MIKNDSEFVDTWITFQILRARAMIVVGVLDEEEAPQEVHVALSSLDDAREILFKQMNEYKDSIVTKFPVFAER
jgi:hypothetical protein